MKRQLSMSLFIIITMIFNCLFYVPIQVNAHETPLTIYYDTCVGDELGDGINETWYLLGNGSFIRHLSHDEMTIKYYFANQNKSGNYKWTTDVSSEEAEIIKEAYANSMKKWNNVYFYDYNGNGIVTKRKIVNIVEGTQDDCNLTIYPAKTTAYYASTGVELLETISSNHYHVNEWFMSVSVTDFVVNENSTNSREVNTLRERTGAHEIGHILGLWDVDDVCLPLNITEDHHYEILMGYGEDVYNRSSDITYKDIAGVAITRGFHTDDDHKWLNAGIQEDGTYKLICSICNGVKYVESLSGISYSTYGYCNSNHDLSDGNMMAVASYGNCDYYKCKYCRYVAPFSDIVPQDYEITFISETYHQYQNMVDGLEYTILEPHIINENYCSICQSNIHFYTHQYVSYSNYAHKAFCECGEYILEDHRHLAPSYDCVFCGAEHEHTYGTSYEWISDKSHTAYCVCGESHIEGHVVSATAFPINGRKICLLCRGLASEGFSQMAVGSLPHTENGSYITPDGITVLADEDIEAFLNGTLEFIYPSIGETS